MALAHHKRAISASNGGGLAATETSGHRGLRHHAPFKLLHEGDELAANAAHLAQVLACYFNVPPTAPRYQVAAGIQPLPH